MGSGISTENNESENYSKSTTNPTNKKLINSNDKNKTSRIKTQRFPMLENHRTERHIASLNMRNKKLTANNLSLPFNVRFNAELPGQKKSKENSQRQANFTNNNSSAEECTNITSMVEKDVFLDSNYIKQWLSPTDSLLLYNHLIEIGNSRFDPTTINSSSKYPLFSLYYGYERELDGAVALDRWGSDFESWMRLEVPAPLPECSNPLTSCCELIRQYFHLSKHSINSILVNFYFDGSSTYIPAHRDTVTCLEDGSSIYCLSLGATRNFVLCDNDDHGKYIKSDMKIAKEWDVSSGDIFEIGPETNMTYCHAVPRDTSISSPRISLIFRSVSRSFLLFKSPPRAVEYANGVSRIFNAEVITTTGYLDLGCKAHISDLIAVREKKKKIKNDKLLLQQQQQLQQIVVDEESLKQFYLGEGVMAIPAAACISLTLE